MRCSRIAALRALSGLPNRAPYPGYLSRSHGNHGATRQLGDAEAALINAPQAEFRFHSGVPVIA